MDTLKLKAEDLSLEITNLLNEESINALAKEVGFTKREGSKINGFRFLDLLLFTHQNQKELSLNDFSVLFYKHFGIKIRKQSIDERFTSIAVIFFKTILEKAINISIKKHQKIDFTKYESVRIKDSTSFQLSDLMKDKYEGSGGSASKSSIRIQFEYDLKNEKILDLSLYPYTTNDMINAKETINDIKANDLIIRDLGYIKIKYLQEIEKKNAFYLNRLHSNTNVYEKKNDKFILIDFGKLYKYMLKNNLVRIDKQVYIGKKEKFKIRMIIEVLPKNELEKRLRKVKKKNRGRKNNISNKHKAKLGLNIFVTNTDIQGKHIRPLYTLRWQIELMFKIWKSIGEIDKIKSVKVERFEAYLFVKLIWIVINWKIMRLINIYFFNVECIEISPYKLYKTLKKYLMDFRNAIVKGLQFEFINEIIDISPYNHKSEKKKYSKTWSYDVIRIFQNTKI